jgi:hypothetical protein
VTDDLKLRCIACWQAENYAEDASYLLWGEPCVHLKAIGGEMRRKLKGRVQIADEVDKAPKKKAEGECPGKLF